MKTEVKVIISFATEDFVTPEHDGILVRLAESLTERGLVGNFHLTGHIARALRRRGRRDVAESIGKHEIGYHSNTHGASPFIGQVFEDRTWDEGLSRMLPAEAKGLRDVEGLVGKQARYFTLEFVKAPQLIYGLRLLGIRQLGYSQIPTFDRAAVWMAGSLCCGDRLLLGMESAPDTPDRLERMRAKFHSLYERARSGENDGVIRAFLHPYKLLTYPGKAWCTVNRSYREHSLPDRDWQVPERYPPEVTRRLLAEHEAMLDHIAGKPGVRFVPLSTLMHMYADQTPNSVPIQTVLELAKGQLERARPMVVAGTSYSPAETYALIVAALSNYAKGSWPPEAIPSRFALGPTDAPPVQESACRIRAEDFLDACVLEDKRTDFYERMSPAVDCAGKRLGPGTFLAAAAQLLLQIAESGALPTEIDVRPRPALPVTAEQEYFQQQTFTREGSYPDGFTGANICRHCRLQSWSVKPAVLV